jgi:hypothetical protein
LVSHSPRSLRPLFSSIAALALATVWTTGCSNMVTTAANTAQSFSIGGTVHGGRQPVAGATVRLMAAGNAGYGSLATVVKSTTSGGDGTFSFGGSYTCPSTSSSTESQYLYLTASGGQPTTGVTNGQAAFMLALGPCSTVLSNNPNVVVDEVTTIATVTALQQFFAIDSVNGLGNIGTSSTNLTGLANAMATVSNLVNAANGQTFASTTTSAAVTGFTTAPIVTITPEATKINTMADILAACINTSGSNTTTPNACNTLYANSGGSPLDTVQAAYYMATIPAGSGTPASCGTGTAVTTAPSICTLYGLASATSPYQSMLTSAPLDWTLGISYASTATSNAGYLLLSKPYYLAIDGSGDVWTVNLGSTSAITNNSVSEFSPTGKPLNQVMAGSLINPSYIAIDPSNDVWVPNYGKTGAGTAVLEYTGSATNTFTTNAGPQRLTIDGQGNVYVLEPAYKGLGDVEEINAGAATATTATTLASGLNTDFSNLTIDANYTLWITGGGTGTTATGTTGASGYVGIFQYVVQPTVNITPVAGGSGAAANAIFTGGKVMAVNLVSGGTGYTVAPTVAISGGSNGSGATVTATVSGGAVTGFTITAAGSGYVLPYAASAISPIATSAVTVPENAIAIDNNNDFFVQNYGKETYAELFGTTSATNTSSTGNSPTVMTQPEFMAIDGSGNQWIADANSTAANGGSVYELTSADTLLSPTGGFYKSSYYYPYGIAIDASGNVWVGSENTSAYAPLTEIVGAASPVGTPMASDIPVIPGGTSKLGTQP